MCWGCPGDPEVWWGEWSGFPLLLSCHVTLSSSWCLSGPMLGPNVGFAVPVWHRASLEALICHHLPRWGQEHTHHPHQMEGSGAWSPPGVPPAAQPPSGFHFFSGHKVGGKPGRGPPGDPGEGGTGGTSRTPHVLLRRVLSSPLQPPTSCPLRSKQSLL